MFYSDSATLLDQEDELINQFKSAVNDKQSKCKKHCCYFCGSLLSNLRKHWRRKHMEERLFQKALAESSKYCTSVIAITFFAVISSYRCMLNVV